MYTIEQQLLNTFHIQSSISVTTAVFNKGFPHNMVSVPMEITETLPDDYRPHTDKYFLRTRHILEQEALNPTVSLRVFARGTGTVAGLEEAVNVFNTYRPRFAEHGGEIWITDKDTFTAEDTLMVVKGPAQSIVELETMYLGILSHHLSTANNYSPPTAEETRSAFQELTSIYNEINVPVIYFGARHFHWSLDKAIADAALSGGAAQTSTDVGSSIIGEEGVGTMPHFLILVMAHRHGREQATLEAAKAFEQYIDSSVPRTTLVDTFNQEVTDTLQVAEWCDQYYAGDDWQHNIRLDTPGENVGEGADPAEGAGVTPSLVKTVKQELIEHGYGRNVDIFLSSGFGDPGKARRFVEEAKDFKEETGFDLFTGVGVGDFLNRDYVMATADIFHVNGESLAKTGREIAAIDYSQMQRVM